MTNKSQYYQRELLTYKYKLMLSDKTVILSSED